MGSEMLLRGWDSWKTKEAHARQAAVQVPLGRNAGVGVGGHIFRHRPQISEGAVVGQLPPGIDDPVWKGNRGAECESQPGPSEEELPLDTLRGLWGREERNFWKIDLHVCTQTWHG